MANIKEKSDNSKDLELLDTMIYEGADKYSAENNPKHQQRLNKFGHYKARNQALAEYGKLQLDENIYKRLYNCRNYLLFLNYYLLQEIKLKRTESCGIHLMCPVCGIERASRAVRIYEEKCKEILRMNPTLRLYYCVLTVKNGENLAERFEHLLKAVKTLIHRRQKAVSAKRTSSKKDAYALNSVFAEVIAGAYSFEAVKGKNSKLWHPHINLLLISEKAIRQNKLSAEWKAITKDSKIVYCERTPDVKQSFIEIFKYALKFSDLGFWDNLTAYETLKGRRLMGSFGEFRGLEIPEEESEEARYQDEPYIELFYQYLSDKKNYQPYERWNSFQKKAKEEATSTFEVDSVRDYGEREEIYRGFEGDKKEASKEE
jgi:hypothetical protein